MRFQPLRPGDDRSRLEPLLTSARVADGRDPLSENKFLELARGAGDGILAEEEGRVVGYAHVSPVAVGAVVEMVLAPDRRSRPLADELLGRALETARPAASVQVWAFEPVLVDAVRARGGVLGREVRQLRRPLPPDRRPGLDADIRPFRPGRDEAAWLAVNNAAFRGHPENGNWDLATLEERMAQPWFDEAGFLMAWDHDELAGFCWTKLHPDSVGEIYVIAVAPEAQGRGLGRELALSGLWDLYERRGAITGMLFVEGGNERGLALYEALGFATVHLSCCFVVEA